jgi:tRNA pseudouridine38-40 synthase
MRIAIKFAYDGRLFHGYARQPRLKTVEGEILNTLIEHKSITDTVSSQFRSASRTDRGVSALGNVIAFNTNTPVKNLLLGLSTELEVIIPYGVKEVNATFNPRYAQLRQYRYYLPICDLDVNKIIAAAALFTGEHDFSNFARVEPDKNPIRTINNIVFTEDEDFLVVDFYAQTFLWQQIRRIISALKKVGQGTLEIKQISDALQNPDKKVDFGLAPAEPLILKNIMYDFEFDYDTQVYTKLVDLEPMIRAAALKSHET